MHPVFTKTAILWGLHHLNVPIVPVGLNYFRGHQCSWLHQCSLQKWQEDPWWLEQWESTIRSDRPPPCHLWCCGILWLMKPLSLKLWKFRQETMQKRRRICEVIVHSCIFVCIYTRTHTHTRKLLYIYIYTHIIMVSILFLLLSTGFLSCDFLTLWLQTTGLVVQVRWESCRLAALRFDWGW